MNSVKLFPKSVIAKARQPGTRFHNLMVYGCSHPEIFLDGFHHRQQAKKCADKLLGRRL